MTANTPQKNLAAVLFLAVFLTACGGGSDSDSSSTSNDSPSQSQEVISEPITSAPVTAEPDDQDNEPNDNVPVNTSDEPTENNAQAALSANNQFSLARTSCGLGGLSMDTALDDIAIQHANYIKYVFANSSPTSFNAHVENKISWWAKLY